jgi:hypothetical protein
MFQNSTMLFIISTLQNLYLKIAFLLPLFDLHGNRKRPKEKSATI